MVSILIPNYNKANYLRETLDSVLVQTYTNWECIIVDDHSTDGSWNILEEYARMDPRFKIFKRPNDRKIGGNAARNFAFENSKGDFIQWLDSDDLIHKNKISEQITDLLSLPSLSLAVTNWKWFDSPNDFSDNFIVNRFFPDLNTRNEFSLNRGFNLLLWLFNNGFSIPVHSYLINANLIKVSGLWNEDLIQNQDGEFMLRVLLKSESIIFKDSILAFYRRPNLSHLSEQKSFESYNDWFKSLLLVDTEMLKIHNSQNVKNVLSLNYERLIKFTGLKYPQITQKALERISFLNSNVKFDFSKPYLLWLGSLIGFKNFLRLRKIFIHFGFLKIT